MNASISSKSIDRAEIKKELKIKESKTIVTVGRFSYKKGYGNMGRRVRAGARAQRR